MNYESLYQPLAMLAFLPAVSTLKLFSPSPYDFIVDPESGKYDEHNGYVNRHYYVQDNYHFGELGILTLNAHVERDTLENEQVDDLLNLIDTHHPTVFPVQGLSERILTEIEKEMEDHYKIGCKNARLRDIRTNKLEVMPIIYDSSVLIMIRESVFEPEKYKEEAYGCGMVFYDRITKQFYTVVSIDLPSTDEKITDAQVYNIIENVGGSKFKDYPLFLAGTINTMSDELKLLVKKSLQNLNALDRNNAGLNKTTFHNRGMVSDNIQRDFILLLDKKKKLKVNYSRTLSRFKKNDFGHFPVFSILSRRLRREED